MLAVPRESSPVLELTSWLDSQPLRVNRGYELQRPVWDNVKDTEEVKAALAKPASKM